jgi:hypothetical protein
MKVSFHVTVGRLVAATILIGIASNALAAVQQGAPCDALKSLENQQLILDTLGPPSQRVFAPLPTGVIAPIRQAPMAPPPYAPLMGQLPASDSLDDMLACTPGNQHFETPQSAWLDNDRKHVGAVLAKTHADTLVVPVQVQGYGLDPIERSVMSADFARALGARGVVADPFLVDRAFGEGRRRITPSEAEEMARRLGAARLITTFVGHDGHHAMALTIQVRDLTAAGSGRPAAEWQKDWRSIAFTDDEPPALVFHRMLPEILAALPTPLAGPKAAARESRAGNAHAVHAALDVTQLGGGKRSTEEALALLATLTGSRDSGIGARLFVRALVASLGTEQSSSRARWLQAYLLMSLDHRPAALARLAAEQGPSFTTLRALLNGNLPAARDSLAKVSDSFQEFLMSIVVHDMELSYQEKPLIETKATAAVFGSTYAAWAPLVAIRSTDRDPWKVAPALAIKAILDTAFPVPDLAADTVLEGSGVVRNNPPDDVNFDLISFQHLERVENDLRGPGCCVGPSVGSGGWELLTLMRSLVESRVDKALYRETRLQNRSDDALRDLERYEPSLEGHPVLVLARANASIEQYLSASGNVKAGWEAHALRAAELAAYLPQGQSPMSWEALSDMASPPTGLGLYLARAYSHDYPQHPYWHGSAKAHFPGAEQRAMDREALAYSREDLWPLDDLTHLLPAAELKALSDGLVDRFVGEPDRDRLLAALRKGSAPEPPDDTLARAREAVDHGAPDFFSYLQLADAEIRLDGQYEAAGRDLLRYPGFNDPKPANRVAESNYAEMFGTRLYTLGRPELAKPFYQISVDLNTGSEASMLSELRLHVIAGDYAAAMVTSQERALSYRDAHAYRDYLSLLHVFGYGKDAWQGFTQVAAGSDDPQIWISALVGHRRDAMTDAAIQQWLLQPHVREAHFDGRRFAPYFAMIWYTADRTPPKNIGDLINQLEWPNGSRVSEDGFHVERPSLADPDVRQVLDWSMLHAGHPERLPPGTPVRSEYAMFMDGYVALRAGKYRQALDAFLLMAGRYPVEPTGVGNWPTYALPYIAYAAAQSGDPTGVEKFVNQLQTGPAFDRWLAKAFFAGVHKDVEAAVVALNAAFREKLFAVVGNGSTRPVLLDYQYAEACEWLYQSTGDRRFVTMLVDWVKRYQEIEPTYAWAYAMEFQYTSEANDRIRALALTMYLDPLSERIKHVSAADRAAAKAWLEINNPFVVRKAKTDTAL